MFLAWRLFGVALVLSFYFFLAAPIGYATFAIWTAFPTRHPERRARKLQAIMKAAFASMHAALRWMQILDFHPGHVEGRIPREPCVLVANHPTLVDISAMIATESQLVFPVKASLFRSYWARPLLKAADQFEASEKDPFAIGRVVEEAIDRLDRGYRVIIFPEGTRSPPDGLHPFGRMAFEIAMRRNVPIIPLVITCEPRWLTRERSFFAPLEAVPRLRIRALEPIHPRAHPASEEPPQSAATDWADGSQGSSSRTLRDIVFRRIQTELGLAEPARGEDAQSDTLSPKEVMAAPGGRLGQEDDSGQGRPLADTSSPKTSKPRNARAPGTPMASHES